MDGVGHPPQRTRIQLVVLDGNAELARVTVTVDVTVDAEPEVAPALCFADVLSFIERVR